MRLILSQYLRTMRERDEFDRLLPDLLLSMGYVPLAKPQTGVRQFGVDLAAVGASPVDGVSELLLFVIKRGDIGRRDWDNPEPTAVRSTINEVLDFYLPKLVAPEHTSLRKVLVLATTGDIKQDVEPLWNSFKAANEAKVAFDFWGGDRVSDLIERHMLDEHLFAAEDRLDLRKTLALAGDGEYDFRDLSRLLLRQLGLDAKGALALPVADVRALRKAASRVHLASGICARWAHEDGDTRQALWVWERALLWSWHRVQLIEEPQRSNLHDQIGLLWSSYTAAAANYFQAIEPYVHVRDGLVGYGSEGAEVSVVLFEHIGLLATIGMACLLEPHTDKQVGETVAGNVRAVADGLCALINNNPASATPRLDAHSIDISLALTFLVGADRISEAKEWVRDLARRLDYCFKAKMRFPVGTDSLDDLVALDTSERDDDELRNSLMRTSWCLATLAAWCAVLHLDDHYAVLAKGAKEEYREVCAQVWHPSSEWPRLWYFGRGALELGETEAPYALPDSADEMRRRMIEFLARPDCDWVATSPSRPVGLWGIDFIACRHFRMPVPASIWYRLASGHVAA